MVYGPIGHSWAGWEPKGPARRFTGLETAIRVLGSVAFAPRTALPDSVVWQFAHIHLPADTLDVS